MYSFFLSVTIIFQSNFIHYSNTAFALALFFYNTTFNLIRKPRGGGGGERENQNEENLLYRWTSNAFFVRFLRFRKIGRRISVYSSD